MLARCEAPFAARPNSLASLASARATPSPRTEPRIGVRGKLEPTNNASEQALRMSVIFRKVTNGFRSNWGAKVYANVCSIVATGKRAGQTALASIRAALARPVTA